ncbi:MAG: hypothetical protein ACTSPD_13525 [Promethearchaeota archaeon]
MKEYNHLKDLINSVQEENVLNKTIVFNPLRRIRNNIDVELFFGMVFALNGAKVKVLLDDGVMMHWDTIQFDNWKTLQINKSTPDIKKLDKFQFNPYNYNFRRFFSIDNHFLEVLFRRNIINKAIKTYNINNLDVIFYSEFLNRNNVKYKNLDELKKHAESSTIRFFRNCDLDYNDKFVRYYYNLSLKNAVLSRMVGEYVLNKLKPDLFITSHGMYSSHGPAFEYLKNKGVNCQILISVSYTKKLYFKFIDTPEQTLSRCKLWEKYKNKPVTPLMIKTVEDYFNQRFGGSSNDIEHYSYMQIDKIFKVKKEDRYKYYICLFPNTNWDGNIRDRHIAFDGLLDWLLLTINYVKNRKNIKMYIKSHPGEMVFSVNTPKILELINKYIDLKTINNIIPIPPHIKINTYKFLESGIDLGITYDGFIGIEMPYLGIPTITCAKGGLSSIEGANITVNTKNEYFNYLDNIDKIIQEFSNNRDKIRENVIRYVYWYLFEDLIFLPSFTTKTQYRFDLMPLEKKDLILNKFMLKILNSSAKFKNSEK